MKKKEIDERNERLLEGCYKTELALAYLPDMDPDGARRCLVRWIESIPDMKAKLVAMGYSDSLKQKLTPEMVRYIFSRIGKPTKRKS